MKINQLLLLSLCVVLLNANQTSISSRMRPVCVAQEAQTYQDDDSLNDEMIEFNDLDDSEINTADLVPLWARWANKVAAPFFVLYSHLNRWWNAEQELSQRQLHNVHHSR